MSTWTRSEPATSQPVSAPAFPWHDDRARADDSDAGLVAGDRGVVDEITPDGVLVEWERGFQLRIDPESTPFHALEAA